jgi:ParB family chromosome partitioning protein
MLRLLKLPEAVKASIRSGELSAGHARALIGQADPERLAREILARGLNVRQVEELARAQAKPGTAGRRPPQKLADTLALEKQMSDALGLAVTIDYRPNGGAVHIKYRTLDQLRDVIRRLERAP